MSKLIYVSSSDGDWCGVYLDGLLSTEGHSIHTDDWLYYLKLGSVDSTDSFEVDWKWVAESGCFPKNFSDIPNDKFE